MAKELHTNIEMALHKQEADKNTKNYLARLTKCFKGTIDAVMGAIELRGPYTPRSSPAGSGIYTRNRQGNEINRLLGGGPLAGGICL